MLVKFKNEFKKIFEKCQIFWASQPLVDSFKAWAFSILGLWCVQIWIILSRMHLWKVKKLLALQVLYEFAFSGLLALFVLIFVGILIFLKRIFNRKIEQKSGKIYIWQSWLVILGLWLFDLYYLKADLENFALRMSELIVEDSSLLFHCILLILVFFVSLMLPIMYALSSMLLIKAREWAKIKQILMKILVIALVFGIFMINEIILVNDYFRIHFHLNLIGLAGLYAFFTIHFTQEEIEKSNLESTIKSNLESTIKSTDQLSFKVLIKQYTLYLYVLYALIPLILIEKPSHLVLANFSKFESHYGMRILSHFGYGKAKGVGQITAEYEKYINPVKIRQIQEEINQIAQDQTVQHQTVQHQITKAPIVILLTIDSLKSELFEGRVFNELKSFEALKKQAIFFPKLYTSSTATRFSLGSMFFGKYPSHLIWKRDSATHPSLEREKGVSLAARLNSNKIKTISITTAKDLMRDQHGIGRGFHQNRLLSPSKKQRVALSHQVIDQILTLLKKQTKPAPLFLYSHIMDAHHPFDAGITVGTPQQRYLSELKLVGQQIDRLIAFIQSQPDADRYYLMITADHGQGFGRHRVKYHNGPPYEHQIKVPFWFYHPQSNQLNTNSPMSQIPINALDYASTPLSLIDLYPTILSIFGISQNDQEPPQTQGLNLWPYLQAIQQGQSATVSQIKSVLEKRLLLSVNWHTRALIIPNENLKLIEDTQLGQVMLFNLKKDPNELHNLCENESKNAIDSDLGKQTTYDQCDQLANSLRLMIEFQGQQPSEF